MLYLTFPQPEGQLISCLLLAAAVLARTAAAALAGTGAVSNISRVLATVLFDIMINHNILRLQQQESLGKILEEVRWARQLGSLHKKRHRGSI